jgi:large subunit ribosomal protein L9
MEVILIKDVDSLGESGEVQNVSDGYARNYLFPKGFAVEATPGAMKDREMRIERIRKKAEKKNQEDMAKAAKVLALGTLTLAARAGEHGKLYGAVTTKELSKLVSDKTGLEVDRKSVKLSHPINRLGEYELQIRFSPKVQASLKVNVVADEDSAVESSYSAPVAEVAATPEPVEIPLADETLETEEDDSEA